MPQQLQYIIYEYYLKNNLEDTLKDYKYLLNSYINWKKINYEECSCCKKLVKKEYRCQVCEKYYYCLDCWDNYTNYCFFCNKHHCFACNIKMRSCKNCYR